MNDSNLKTIDRRIKSLECLASVGVTSEDNPLMKQLKTLREEIITKAHGILHYKKNGYYLVWGLSQVCTLLLKQ